MSDSYTARYWKKISDEEIVCLLCPRGCILKKGQRGFCFVRQHRNGAMILTTYGRSSGFCVDPIEKKPLHHFYPGTGILSFGTAGCNLGCHFCQNWDISKSKETQRLTEDAPPQAIARAAKKFGCKSVAFTYNEPIIFAEYAIDVAKACHQEGIMTVAVTAGYVNKEARQDFFAHMDAANVDLKAFSERFYRELALGALQPVLDTLTHIKKNTNAWLEITNLLIPQENDSEQEIHEMTEWIADNLGFDVPLHFSAFHPDFKMRDKPPTPRKTLTKARTIALSKGLRYVYTGNVHGVEEASTYCPKCHKRVIERNWYELSAYHIKDGKCQFCQTPINGRFENKVGNWGPKRQPLTMT